MKHKFIFLVAATLWGGMPRGWAANWPTHQHDNARSGVTSEGLDAPTLAQAWIHQAQHAPRTAWHGRARRDAWNFVTDQKGPKASLST